MQNLGIQFGSKTETYHTNGKNVKIKYDSKNRVVAWTRTGKGEKTSAKIKYSQITDWSVRDSLIQSKSKIIRQTVTKDRYSNASGYKRTVFDTELGFWSSLTKKPLEWNFSECIVPFENIKKTAKSMIKSI